MLNPNYLQTYIKLVEVGHFGQTAEQLFMTQPGVTQHIKKLEQQVGQALLNRVGKRFELTQAGQELYQYGKQLVQQQSQFIKSLGQDDPYSGECRIACSGSMAMLIYPHLLELQLSHPELTMSVEAAPNNRIIEGVVENHIDLGIVTGQVAHPQLNCEHFGEQNLCVALPASYAGKTISYDDLATLGMISSPDGMHYWRQIAECFFKDIPAKYLQIPSRTYVNQLNQILLPVAKGLGFAVLPEFAVQHSDVAEQLYLAQQFDGQDEQQTVSEPLLFVSKTHRQLPSRYDAVIEIIRQLVNKAH
ncbi:LysR family transcriptional regulator [Shewanella maritima]|uniref:LysR family transcriptional regulator n=1 Tax=Shewanella maritima TaxID=2520507 RepID=UPI003736C193